MPENDDEIEARRWYHEQLDAIQAKIDMSGPPTENLAREVFRLRNEAKRGARARMKNRNAAAELDRTDPIRPFEYYVAKGRSKGLEDEALWAYLIDSAQRSRPEVDKHLGLPRKPR